ncbi:hypothetical protein FLA_6031 [Filimonas lacunae]|nr:hypothetical protein FLA_6031 [Filimonas lacunae]
MLSFTSTAPSWKSMLVVFGSMEQSPDSTYNPLKKKYKQLPGTYQL